MHLKTLFYNKRLKIERFCGTVQRYTTAFITEDTDQSMSVKAAVAGHL